MGKKIENYRELKTFEVKKIPAFIKQLDEDQGIVEHFVAVLGNIDAGGDLIPQKAFAKTIRENKRIRVLDQHQSDSVLRVVGKPLELREVGRKELTPEVLEYAPDATGGLLATTQYAIETDNGRNVFELIKGGFVDESSIGYDAIQIDYKDMEIDGHKQKVRILSEIRLWEYSNVIFGMNPATAVVSAKSDTSTSEQPETKKVTSFQDLPMLARSRAWDADKAEGRIRAWAGGEDDMDWKKYATAFLWYDTDNPEVFGSYKLPYADILRGRLFAIPKGIFAVAAALGGARGGVDLPEADQTRIKAHVARYYAKMQEEFYDESLVPPWDKDKGEEMETEEKKEPAAEPETNLGLPFLDLKVEEPEPAEAKDYGYRLGDILEGNLHYAFTCLVDKWFVQGVMDRDERMTLLTAISDALELLHNRITDDLSGRDVSYPIYNEPMGHYSLDPDLEGKETGDTFGDTEPQQMLELLTKVVAAVIVEGKAGRVLSSANAAKIQQALAHLNEVLMTAGLIEEAAMHDDEEDEEETHKRKPQQKENEAGPGDESPPTLNEAGPNNSSPTSEHYLLQMIEVERSENDLFNI